MQLNYTEGVQVIYNFEEELIEFNMIIDQCFKTLTDFCVGPCYSNQNYLSEYLIIIEYIN